MGKSRRFGNDQSFKNHRETDKYNRKSMKSGWKHKNNYSDRDLNRRIQQGDYDEYDY